MCASVMRKKIKPRKKRDPFWRTRRAFRAKRKDSAKLYRRAERRRMEREARHGGR